MVEKGITITTENKPHEVYTVKTPATIYLIIYSLPIFFGNK